MVFEVAKNKDLNVMRLSPGLVTVFAVLSALNLATPVRGQTPDTVKDNQASHLDLESKNNLTVSQNSQPEQHSSGAANLILSSPKTTQAPTTIAQSQEPTLQFPGPEQPTPENPFPEDPTEVAPNQPAVEEEIPLGPKTPRPEENQTTPSQTPPDQGTPTQTPPDQGTPTQTPPDQGTPTQTPPAPPGQGAPTPAAPTAQPQPPEPEVLVSEVVVEGAEGDLLNTVYQAISTRPGRTTTRSQLQEDINAIFGTGFFSNVKAEPADTPLGVRVTFIVQPNPTLRSVQLAGNKVLPQEKVNQIFAPQYGQILNLKQLQEGIKQINQYYQSSGYVLGQVIGAPEISPDGTVTLQVAEGVVEDINVRYLNKQSEPTKGKTRKFIITRELRTKPGNVLNRDVVQRDLRRLYELGLFEDVQVALEPGQDPRQVVVTLNVKERKTGAANFGAGISSASGIFGTASYVQSNLGGNNQTLSTEVQVGTRELLFDVSFTDPWIAGDPYHTSYTVNVFNRLTVPYVFSGGPRDVNLPNGDTPRVNRLGGGIVFTRPLTRDLDKISRSWVVSAGLQYQLVSIRDAGFDVSPFAVYGPKLRKKEPLSFSGTGQDDLLTFQTGVVRDLRNDPITPTQGSLIRFGVEQSVPVGSGSILMNRVRASYSYFIPVSFLKFSKGPQTLAFNIQGGTVVGDLPPYEAFTLGGSNSVRGYGEGEVGSGRSFAQATAEYRFPLFNISKNFPIGGALFFDAASTLGTQGDVLGKPGLIRRKPGSGFGYGAGIRVRTPLGNVRIDYGINDQGDNQFSFGLGERF